MRPDSRRARGRRGEDLAAAHLERAGYLIVARNVRLRGGELDVVALERGSLCFVEVRLRSGAGYGTPEESIDARKRRRLARAARELLATRPLPPHRGLRFDVVAIDAREEPPRIRLLRDAFQIEPG
jgi:putative endonuclease